MTEFSNQLAAILEDDVSAFRERDPETFFASQIGFCPRQLYVQKLGLGDDELSGTYRIARLIQRYLEERFSETIPGMTAGVSVEIDEGDIRFVGRCHLVDRDAGIAYVLKVRNGWYKFSPPVDRHLDQLHIYLRGLDVDRGKLIYISKNDLLDTREWPPNQHDQEAVVFDEARYESLVAKAERLRHHIWTDGIATSEADIPFAPCGCYFCREEELAMPDIATPPAPEHGEKSDGSSGTHAVVDDAATSSVDLGERGVRSMDATGYHVPGDLRSERVWVVWDGQDKLARAPWQTETMFPCEWAASKAVDPRRPFAKANMVAELPVETIHRTWPFPDGDLPDAVRPAVLLPHEPADPPLAFVDFDDVRDPASGLVTAEAAALVDELGGYAELSRSGRGLHVWVRGHLPGSLTAFTAPLQEGGSVEIYTQSRFTGGTWRHVEGTPRDAVPEATSTLANVVSRYSRDDSVDTATVAD